MISSSQRPLPDNTRHSQQTNIHTPGGIRTHDLSRWAAYPPPGAWIFVCCECRVLSGRGICDELITDPEESYRLCCIIMCDLETSRIGAPYIYDIRSLRVNIKMTPIQISSRSDFIIMLSHYFYENPYWLKWKSHLHRFSTCFLLYIFHLYLHWHLLSARIKMSMLGRTSYC